MKNATIKEIVNEIEKKSDFKFLISGSLKNEMNKKVDINVNSASIEELLKMIFRQSGLKYNIIEKQVIIYIESENVKKEKKLMENESYASIAEDKKITGQVTDPNGEPLVGVTVRAKNAPSRGCITDVKGNFTFKLKADENAITLVFSYVGFKKKEMLLKAGEHIKVVLEEDATTLSDVVITGMQVVKKEQMTGSATVVTAREIKDQGITSIDRIIEGKIAGLNSITISGAPGVRSQIVIRGENSLSGNTEPLWILDGLPILQGVPKNNSGNYAATIMQDGVGNVMPEDIESISILKDASAAAIYGARASNGVIVITTKKGFRSKTQINYSGSYELGMAPKVDLGMMNSQQKLNFEKSIIDNFGLNYAYAIGRGSLLLKKLGGYITPEAYDAEMKRLAGINTNWFKEIFRVSQSQMHNINLRGGSEELSYYTSLNYTDKKGILASNRYQNAGLFMTLDYRPIQKLIVSLNVSANSRKNQDHASALDPFKYAVFANPYERPYDDNGNYAYDLSYINNNYTNLTPSGYLYDKLNIIKEMRENTLSQTAIDASATLHTKYEPLKGLIFSVIMRKSLGYNYESKEINAGTYSSWLTEKFARAAKKGVMAIPEQYDNGEFREASGRSSSWSVRPQVDYSFTVNENHLFTLLGATEISSRKFNNFAYNSPIYFADYRITGLPTFNDTQIPYDGEMYKALKNLYTTSDGQDRSLSYIGIARYGYADRYILNFSIRADGADVIGNRNKFTPLWSIGGRYNIHQEPFFKKEIVNELSLRASYGYTGQIDRTAYPFSVIEIGDMFYMGNRFVKNYAFPNPTVKWSKKKDINFGFDIGVLQNRIFFTADLYSNRTEDILSDLTIPYSTGRSQVLANGGIVENRGLELSLNVRWIEKGDWFFSTRFNIATNSNKILRSLHNYKSYADLLTKGSPVKGGVYDIEGEQTRGVYGWKTAGVNPLTGNPRYYLTEAGKEKYAELLKNFDNLSASDQDYYKSILPSLTKVPDIVDFDLNKDKREEWQIPSLQYLGQLNPKYVGGFNTYLKYRSIEFITDWIFKTGYLAPTFIDYQDAPKNLGPVDPTFAAQGYSTDLAVSSTNRQQKYMNYWQMRGDQTSVKRFSTGTYDLWTTMFTDDKYEKGDYLRLSNVSISYRINPKILRKYSLNNMQIGIVMRNLLTFTKYKGIDVATGNAFGYPTSKEFSLKLLLGF